MINLLDCIVPPKVVHHVSFGPEAFATVLRTDERPLIVMNAHMHRQVVSIVERFAA